MKYNGDQLFTLVECLTPNTLFDGRIDDDGVGDTKRHFLISSQVDKNIIIAIVSHLD